MFKYGTLLRGLFQTPYFYAPILLLVTEAMFLFICVKLGSHQMLQISTTSLGQKFIFLLTCLLYTECLCYSPLAHVGTGQVMGWGEKAIEVRSVQTGQLDGVFMHKRVQAFTFLCERNEKVIQRRPANCNS